MTIDAFETMREDVLGARAPLRVRRTLARGVKGARETGRGGVHRAVVALVRRAYPQARVVHLENETFGRLTEAQIGAKVADGMWIGAPDLAVFWDNGTTVFLECKAEAGGVVEGRQQDCHRWLRGKGFFVAVVCSVDEARQAFRDAGVIR